MKIDKSVWGMTFRIHIVQLSSLHSPNTAFTGVLFSAADISSLPWVSSDVFIALCLCNAGSRLKRDNLPEGFFFFLFPQKKNPTTAQKQLPEFNVSTTVNAKLNQISAQIKSEHWGSVAQGLVPRPLTVFREDLWKALNIFGVAVFFPPFFFPSFNTIMIRPYLSSVPSSAVQTLDRRQG